MGRAHFFLAGFLAADFLAGLGFLTVFFTAVAFLAGLFLGALFLAADFFAGDFFAGVFLGAACNVEHGRSGEQDAKAARWPSAHAQFGGVARALERARGPHILSESPFWRLCSCLDPRL